MTATGNFRARWPNALMLGLPAALLCGAYAWLAAAHGTALLWGVPVHESGRYTLGQTILYVRHFVREVPVDVAMGLFCAAGVTAAEPGRRQRPTLTIAAGVLAASVTAAGLAAAVGQEGWRETLHDLLQYRTRDDDLAYGAHWSFHLLSTVWFGAAAALGTGILAGLGGPARPLGPARGLLAGAWGWVVLLTAIFGVHAQVFTSARYIGHQAREIMTHGLVTLPLAVGIARLTAAGAAAEPPPRAAPWWRVASWLVMLGVPLFLVVAFWNVDLTTTGQMREGLAGIVAAHVFEHTLDVVLVAVVALAAAGYAGGRRKRGDHSP